MSVRRDVVLSGATAVIQTGARFAVAAVLARGLSRELFGQFIYLQWLVDMALLLGSLGFNGVASRFFAEARNEPDVQGALVAWWRPLTWKLAGLAGLLASLGALVSGLQLTLWQLVGLSVWAALNAAWGFHVAALTGLQRFSSVLWTNIAFSVPMLTGAAVAYASTAGLTFLISVMIGAVGLAGLVAFGPVRSAAVRGAVPAEIQSRIRSYALNVWGVALLAALVWSRGELPIVRLHLGDTGVGDYAPALTLLGGAVAAIMLGIRGAEPEMTRLLGAGRPQAALELARTVLAWQLVMGTLGALVLIWFAPEVLTIAFGREFVDSAPTLAVLALVVPSMCFTAPNHILLIETNAVYNRNLAAAGVVVLCGAALILVPALGILGAGLARAGTVGVMGLVTLVVWRRRWDTDRATSLGYALSLLVCASSAFGVGRLVESGPGTRAGLFVLATAVAILGFAALGTIATIGGLRLKPRVRGDGA